MAQSICRPIRAIAPPQCSWDDVRISWPMGLPSSTDRKVKQPLPFRVRTNLTLERTDNTTIKVITIISIVMII
jgi:hypothetical protein